MRKDALPRSLSWLWQALEDPFLSSFLQLQVGLGTSPCILSVLTTQQLVIGDRDRERTRRSPETEPTAFLDANLGRAIPSYLPFSMHQKQATGSAPYTSRGEYTRE